MTCKGIPHIKEKKKHINHKCYIIPGNRQQREKNTKLWSPFCTDNISKVLLGGASKQDYSKKLPCKNWRVRKLQLHEGNLETRSRILAFVRRISVLSDKPVSMQMQLPAPPFLFQFSHNNAKPKGAFCSVWAPHTKVPRIITSPHLYFQIISPFLIISKISNQ